MISGKLTCPQCEGNNVMPWGISEERASLFRCRDPDCTYIGSRAKFEEADADRWARSNQNAEEQERSQDDG